MGKKIDKYGIESTDYTIGQDNIKKWGFDVHNSVFTISAGLIIIFLLIAFIADPKEFKGVLDGLKLQIIKNFDWFFMSSANILVIFCLGLIFSPFGKIRLGGANAVSDYSFLSWVSMLFAAGMGIGLMFWSVAEPVAYFTGWYETPLNAIPNSDEAKELAFAATMYHWGLHPWAIYAVVSLSLAFFAYNKGLPLAMRSIFYPILGDRTWGLAGHIVDIMSVIATLFGLATSLGLGAKQAASGINQVFGLEIGLGLEIGVIAFVTMLAMISVIRGIDGGVKVISNINLGLAFSLLLLVGFITFSSSFIKVPDVFMSYIKNIIPLSNPVGREDTTWLQGWTVFYWAWWISWSPFVGMFIARVSKGRTIREFIVAVLIIPTIVTLVWMTVFGNLGINQVIENIGELGKSGLTDVSLAMFQAFEQLPLSNVLSILAIILVMVFFVTSADSGSLVIDAITAGGKTDTPTTQRVLWAFLGGAVATALLWIGGVDAMQALQAGAISTALPFTIILLLMCISLVMGMLTEDRAAKK